MKKIGLLAVAVMMLLSSCDSYTTSGALVGGMVGSAVGRITGGYRGSDVGALVGAAVGAAAGAAARDAEQRRMEAAYYDDVYGNYRSNDPRAERVARYHAKTKAKYSGRVRSSQGFSVTTRSQSSQQKPQQQTEQDNSGYSDQPTYDDRIEIK